MHIEYERLNKHIAETYNAYRQFDDELSGVKLSSDKWSLKQIFGHLIDSAANNYQRFIRLQETEELVFPAYDYNWIEIIDYNSYPYDQILKLWKQYNLLLCHIIKIVPESKLNNVWLINDDRLTLEFLITDYIDHMEWHLEQLKDRLSEVRESAGRG